MKLPAVSSTTATLGALLMILALLVVPIPRPLVDIGLVLSLGCGLLLLSSTLRARHPLDFTTFPALVLIATLLRLGLNVATTRWILSTGDAGAVVRAFGDFAAAGDPLVGAAVFIVITILLVVVVSKGAERVAEVAARFSLDGMPGRQMAIDADMRAGVVTFEQARERRSNLQREARLYGSMDGAMKFVRGDTIAGIAITCINLILGVVLGVTRDGLSAGDAFSHYGILTIGDGLCSQVPSLLTAVASGLMVTRVPNEGAEASELAHSLREELLRGRGRWWEVGGGLVLLGLLPGLPLVPFAVLAGVCGAIGFVLGSDEAAAGETSNNLDEGYALQHAVREERPSLLPAAADSEVILEIGADVSRWLSTDQGAALAAELQLVTYLLHDRRGIRQQAIATRLNASSVGRDQVRVLMAGRELRRTRLRNDLVWGFASAFGSRAIEPTESWIHPLSGVDVWGVPSDAGPAERLQRIELPRRVAMEVIGAVWQHASGLLSVSKVQTWLESMDTGHPGLVDALIPERMSLSGLTACLREVLASGFHLREFATALDAVACCPGGSLLSHDEAVARMREALAGSVLTGFLSGGLLFTWVFPGALMETLDEELEQGVFDITRWVGGLRALDLGRPRRGVLVVPREGRKMIEELVRNADVSLFVIAMEEVPSYVETVVLGHVLVAPPHAPTLAPPPELSAF